MNTACKICGSDAPLHGVVDFNKSCESRNRPDVLRGEAVWYHRCAECGFLFTSQFDGWTPGQWRREVYNDEYTAVDPEQASGARVKRDLTTTANYARQIDATRILDFGGGNGLLSRLLCEAFFDAQTYDPLFDDERPPGDFDLITAFEVLEHTTTPKQTLAEIGAWLRPGGIVLFSTLTDETWDCGHWYCAPRNGHVSLHSRKSLHRLFDGWEVEHFNIGVHRARRIQA